MYATAFLLFLAAVFVVAAVTYKRSTSITTRRPAALVTLVSAVLFVILAVVSTLVIVPARNIGVVTSLGRPVGTVDNGPHVIWPWQDVEKFDATIQINKYTDDNGQGEGQGSAILVRLGNSSNAYVDVSIRWELKQDTIEEQYLQYKTMEFIRENLVTRNLQTSLNEVFGAWNPLATINPAVPGQEVRPTATESKLPDLAIKVTNLMKEKVGNEVTIYEVQIPTIAFDQETQNRLDELSTQTAKTSIAVEQENTNRATKAANDALNSSLTPEILTNKCLDVVREKGGSPFGCFPGSQAVPTLPVGQAQ